jgi:hypothetical protein
MSSMLTFSQRRTLIFESLTDAQRTAAAGRYSGPSILHDDDAARIISYFAPGQSATVRKVSLLSSKAILYADQGTFRILSSPALTLDLQGREIFVGHDGDSTIYPLPISIVAEDATSNLKVLLYDSSNPDTPSALHDLTATRHILETPTTMELDEDGAEVESQVAFPFPIAAPDYDFADYRIGAIPAAVPLPSGHSLDPVVFTIPDDMMLLQEKLKDICPHLSEWALALNNAYKWWGPSTLDDPTFMVPDIFGQDLPTNHVYHDSIFLPLP